MTVRSLARVVVQLLAGDHKAWTYLPYQIVMKCRGVDLGWVSVRDSALSEARSHWHSNSGGPDLDRLLRTLPISASDSAVDIGCGKGGAILTLRRYPFARVDGIEIAPQLAAIARANLARLDIVNSSVFCCDAAEFTDLHSYTYFYLYNPFPEIVMNSVMNNISSSLEKRPRDATLIYKNPIFENRVLRAGFSKVSQTRQTHPHYPPFAVYRTQAGQTARVVQVLTHERS